VVTLGVFLRSIAAFAFAKVTAAYLGPVEYATYGHYYMVASYLVSASCFGLGNAFTVYIARSSDSRDSAASQIQAVVAAGAFSGVVVAFVLLGLFVADTRGILLPHIRGWHLIWWFVFCAVAAIGTAVQSVLLGLQQHVRYQLVTALNPLVSTIFLLVASLLASANPTVAIVAYMAGFLVPIAAFPKMIAAGALVRRSALKGVAFFSRPYLLPSLLTPTIGTVSVLAVRHIVSTHVSTYSLGLWQALWRLSEGYMGALISVGTALFLPRFSRIATRSDARRGIGKAALMLLAMYAPLALCFIFSPTLVLDVLLSRDFAPIASLLPVQIVGDSLKILCFLLELYFTCTLAPRIALLGELLFSGMFLGITPLIMSHSRTPSGAVWAYTLSYALVLCLLIPLAWKRSSRFPLFKPS
jgi:O-antigen/teichoic acid export membrane protein